MHVIHSLTCIHTHITAAEIQYLSMLGFLDNYILRTAGGGHS